MSSTHVLTTTDGKLIAYSTSEHGIGFLLSHLRALFPDNVKWTADGSLSFVNLASRRCYPDKGEDEAWLDSL